MSNDGSVHAVESELVTPIATGESGGPALEDSQEFGGSAEEEAPLEAVGSMEFGEIIREMGGGEEYTEDTTSVYPRNSSFKPDSIPSDDDSEVQQVDLKTLESPGLTEEQLNSLDLEYGIKQTERQGTSALGSARPAGEPHGGKDESLAKGSGVAVSPAGKVSAGSSPQKKPWKDFPIYQKKRGEGRYAKDDHISAQRVTIKLDDGEPPEWSRSPSPSGWRGTPQSMYEDGIRDQMPHPERVIPVKGKVPRPNPKRFYSRMLKTVMKRDEDGTLGKPITRSPRGVHGEKSIERYGLPDERFQTINVNAPAAHLFSRRAMTAEHGRRVGSRSSSGNEQQRTKMYDGLFNRKPDLANHRLQMYERRAEIERLKAKTGAVRPVSSPKERVQTAPPGSRTHKLSSLIGVAPARNRTFNPFEEKKALRADKTLTSPMLTSGFDPALLNAYDFGECHSPAVRSNTETPTQPISASLRGSRFGHAMNAAARPPQPSELNRAEFRHTLWRHGVQYARPETQEFRYKLELKGTFQHRTKGYRQRMRSMMDTGAPLPEND